MKILYLLINSFKKEKPYFSLSKYLDYISKIKNPTIMDSSGLNEREKTLLDYINNDRSSWWINMDGKELIQVSNDRFLLKDKNKRAYSVSKEWVEWQ
jgi:hypothetical protein